MPESCFATLLGDHIELNDTEKAALARLEERERPVKRGAVLLREKDRVSELFILKRGTMMSYVLLDDGSRQILRFLFPGDVLAMSALAYRHSPETLAAVTDAVVCPFERTSMTILFEAHPRLAGAMMALAQVEQATLTDRLAALGRASARGRVAALLIGLRNSMRRRDAAVSITFPLGLTQEEIGDATGLTAVHVNRMMRQIEDEGLIARETGRVTLLNEKALIQLANHVDRLDGLDLSWLPQPSVA